MILFMNCRQYYAFTKLCTIFYKITQFTTIYIQVLYIKLIKKKLRNKLLKSTNDLFAKICNKKESLLNFSCCNEEVI